MGWVARKFDNLGSALCGGGGGMGLSQAPAFTQAYLQRLGGHIDEARRTLGLIERGELLQRLGPDDRAEAVAEFSARLAELEWAHQSIVDSPAMLQPMMMLRHAEADIASRAWESFTPAIPVDPPSLVYTALGVVLALIVYELIKSPTLLIKRSKRKGHSPA